MRGISDALVTARLQSGEKYIHINIESAFFFCWVSHLHSKGERPTARGWRAASRRKGLRIQRDGVEDEE